MTNLRAGDVVRAQRAMQVPILLGLAYRTVVPVGMIGVVIREAGIFRRAEVRWDSGDRTEVRPGDVVVVEEPRPVRRAASFLGW